MTFIDPQDAAASFLGKLAITAVLEGPRGELYRQAMRGEIHWKASQALSSSPTPVHLERFALYAIGSPERAPISGLGLSGISGEGVLRPISPTVGTWRLEMSFRATVSYDQLQMEREHEREQQRDYEFSPSISFSGNLILNLRLDQTESLGSSLRIETGVVALTQEESVGSLSGLRLDLKEVYIYTFAASQTPRMTLPLRPVVFPLGNGQYTGSTWQDQLASANRVWMRCCIELVQDGLEKVERPDLAHSVSAPDIRSSYNNKGLIEIYFVRSKIGAQATPLGKKNAKVIIPEPNDFNPNLLAHELGHVLGGCHPYDRDPQCPWRGSPGTVLASGCPNLAYNSKFNCRKSRKYQPLLETGLQQCRMTPEF